MLVGLARAHHELVNVRGHPDNVAALRCYAAAGPATVPAAEAAAWNNGQPNEYTWMAYPS